MAKRTLILLSIFITLFCLFGIKVFAQVQNLDVVLDSYPSNPKANENVIITAKSYVVDLNKSYFVWRLNDEVKSAGIGKTSFSFVLANVSMQNVIDVEIQTVDKKTLNKGMVIASANVDLLWEAVDSYSPPFYKGKTLIGREADVKVVAIPSLYSQGRKISPHTLSYNWSVDGDNQPSLSGFGKNYFIFKNSFLDKYNKASVIVSDLNKENEVAEDISIVPITPKILFYKKDSSGIKLEKTLDSGSFIDKKGENIVAVPYFFTPSYILLNDLEINWYINNEKVEPNIKNEISVKPIEDVGGQSKIKVDVVNLQTLFQEASKEIIVNF